MSVLVMAPDIALVPCGETTVLGRLPDGPVWVLEGTAAIVATHLTSPVTVDAILDDMMEQSAADRGEVERGVADFVAALQEIGAVVAVDGPSAG